MRLFNNTNTKPLYRVFSSLVIVTFTVSSLTLPGLGYAQSQLNLPVPGTMISLSAPFNPPIVKGITIYPDNPLKFDFLIDPGDDNLQGEALEKEASKLIKYFMASLTVPEDEMWVNLSPYEKDRIIPDGLSQTELGRDLLSQDYILKQLTASLMYPEEELGNDFWERVYAKAQERYGTSDIPMNTFNKVWIVPEKANVYVNGNNVFVVDNHLKVALEEDYLALESNLGHNEHGVGEIPEHQVKEINDVSSEVIREVIIPAIEKEVNQGKNFSNLRQIFNSMILATWYKQNLKESLLGQVYANQNKIEGITLEDKLVKEKIYTQYVDAFEKGVYNYIKEDYDAVTQKIIPRKYYSGGIAGHKLGVVGKRLGEQREVRVSTIETDFAGISVDAAEVGDGLNETSLISQGGQILELDIDRPIDVPTTSAYTTVISKSDAADSGYEESFAFSMSALREQALGLILQGELLSISEQTLLSFLKSNDVVLLRIGLYILEKMPERFNSEINNLLVTKRDEDTEYITRNAINEIYKKLGIDGTESFQLVRVLKSYRQKWRELSIRKMLQRSQRNQDEIQHLANLRERIEKGTIEEMQDAIIEVGMLKGSLKSALKKDALDILDSVDHTFLNMSVDRARKNLEQNLDTLEMIRGAQSYTATAYNDDLNTQLEKLKSISEDLKRKWKDKFVAIIIVGSASQGYWMPTSKNDFDVVVIGTDPKIEADFLLRAHDLNIDRHSLVPGNKDSSIFINPDALMMETRENRSFRIEKLSFLFNGLAIGDNTKLLDFQQRLLSEISEQTWNSISQKVFREKTKIGKAFTRFGITDADEKRMLQLGIALRSVPEHLSAASRALEETVSRKSLGGIDLNPANLEMSVQGSLIEMKTPVDLRYLYNANVEGFLPVIINISPVTSVPMLMSVKEEDEEDQLTLAQ